jgi:hypothetical protein
MNILWLLNIVWLLVSVTLLSLAFIEPGRTHPASGLVSQGGATSRRESPFACNRAALTPEARKRHFDELGPLLRAGKKTVRELANGFEFEFPSDPATFALVTEWAAGERLCCPFFDINVRLEREGGSLWLGLTGREGVKAFVKADLGPWFRS